MALLSVAALAFASKVAGESPSPIRKVVTMIDEMKATVEKEGKEDLKAYDEYKCWCSTNGEEKKRAIEYSTEQIADLEAFIGEASGTEGKLKTEISSLEADIALIMPPLPQQPACVRRRPRNSHWRRLT